MSDPNLTPTDDTAARAREWADALRGVIIGVFADSVGRSSAALADVADLADRIAPLAAEHADRMFTAATPAERNRAKRHLRMLKQAAVQMAQRHKRKAIQANADRLGEIVGLFVQGAVALAGGGLGQASMMLTKVLVD